MINKFSPFLLPLFFVLLLLSKPSLGVSPLNPTKYYIVECSETEGLFSTLVQTLGFLRLYYANQNVGMKVDFGTKGLYYDETKGPNWWEYYFEPIELGSPENSKEVEVVELDFNYAWSLWRLSSRKRVNHLILRYVKIKEPILEKVKRLKESLFSPVTIGVHYRGTDMKGLRECQGLCQPSYETYCRHVLLLLDCLKTENYTLFVATDESEFLNFMKQRFSSHVVCYEESYRSEDSQPVHFNKELNPYKKGEDALIDCLLLSECTYLVSTNASQLSQCATYFNPSLPVFLVKNNDHPLDGPFY